MVDFWLLIMYSVKYLHETDYYYGILFVVSCANKQPTTFIMEVPHTYEEEKRVHDKYPVEHVEIENLN